MERGLTCIAVLNVTVMGAVAFALVELSAGSVEITAGGCVLGAVVTKPKTKFWPRGTAAVAPRGLPTTSVIAEEIVAVYAWSDWRFASGVNVATLFAGSMATTPVTAPAIPASVKVVFETPVTGSLNVAVSALFAGTLMSLFAGTVAVTVGAMVSIAPLRLMITGGLAKGVVTGMLTSADLVPFTAVAVGSENVTVKVQVPPPAARVAPEQVSAAMTKSAALAPVGTAGATPPSVAMLTVSGFLTVTVTGADTNPAFCGGNTTGFGVAEMPTTFPPRKKKESVKVLMTGAALHAAPPPLAQGPVILTKLFPVGLPVTAVAEI